MGQAGSLTAAPATQSTPPVQRADSDDSDEDQQSEVEEETTTSAPETPLVPAASQEDASQLPSYQLPVGGGTSQMSFLRDELERQLKNAGMSISTPGSTTPKIIFGPPDPDAITVDPDITVIDDDDDDIADTPQDPSSTTKGERKRVREDGDRSDGGRTSDTEPHQKARKSKAARRKEKAALLEANKTKTGGKASNAPQTLPV